jgi:hypothetical protein
MQVQSDWTTQQTPRSIALCATDVGLHSVSWPGCASSTMQRQPPPVGLQEIVEPAPPAPLPPTPPSAPPPGTLSRPSQPTMKEAAGNVTANRTLATNPQRTR